MQTKLCSICQKEVGIKLPGQYTDILECGHIVVKTPISNIVAKGATAVEAEEISKKLEKISELPKIDSADLINRALSTVNQVYEDFFNAENPLIEELIREHGRDQAILVFIAIHSHLSKVLFCVNRFRNVYYVKIEQLRKEIEDKAVKELIQNHDFFYEAPKAPKKPRTIGGKLATEIDKAKVALGGLTDSKGNPVDVTKVLANLMWKKKPDEDYKAGLDKIKESIQSKEPK